MIDEKESGFLEKFKTRMEQKTSAEVEKVVDKCKKNMKRFIKKRTKEHQLLHLRSLVMKEMAQLVLSGKPEGK